MKFNATQINNIITKSMDTTVKFLSLV